MRVHKMLKWDQGQVLIKASDELFDCALELKETQPGFAQMLFHMACVIGDKFNAYGSHGFGLRGTDACPCPECKPRCSHEWSAAGPYSACRKCGEEHWE